MKKILLFLLVAPLFISCETGSFNNRNPYIPNYQVNLSLNLSLPQYSNLQFASNYVVDYSQGARGIVVFNAGGGGFVAFDLACPNQALSSCSTMTVSGVNATCPCDNAVYSLFSGQSPGLQYPMKQYRVDVSGGVLTVYN